MLKTVLAISAFTALLYAGGAQASTAMAAPAAVSSTATPSQPVGLLVGHSLPLFAIAAAAEGNGADDRRRDRDNCDHHHDANDGDKDRDDHHHRCCFGHDHNDANDGDHDGDDHHHHHECCDDDQRGCHPVST